MERQQRNLRDVPETWAWYWSADRCSEVLCKSTQPSPKASSTSHSRFLIWLISFDKKTTRVQAQHQVYIQFLIKFPFLFSFTVLLLSTTPDNNDVEIFHSDRDCFAFGWMLHGKPSPTTWKIGFETETFVSCGFLRLWRLRIKLWPSLSAGWWPIRHELEPTNDASLVNGHGQASLSFTIWNFLTFQHFWILDKFSLSMSFS